MKATCILVEGKDDIAFIRRLIDKERQGAKLSDLKWTLLNEDDKVILGRKHWAGNCYAEKEGKLFAIMEVKGVYQVEEALDVDPAYSSIPLVRQDVPVTEYLGIFDADAKVNFLGNSVNHGGCSVRRGYLSGKLSKSGKTYSIFLLADDGSDTTLEDLVVDMIDPRYAFLLTKNWKDYRSQLKTDLLQKTGEQALAYSKKCELSQFATIFDTEVAKDLYWVAALWNDAIWDWSAPRLNNLKCFLRQKAPELFR